MRIVVTGGAGFLGGHLVETLLEAGHRVLILDALRTHYDVTAREWLVGELAARDACEFRLVDLASDDLEPHIDGADAVVHLAARPGVAASWGNDFGDYVVDNLVASQRLLRAVSETGGTRLVFASSSSVYGKRPGVHLGRDALAPRHPYGVTKLAGEQLCRTYAQYASDISVVLLRYFTLYGPRQRPDMAVSRFIAAAETGEPILLHGGGRQTRRFTYVQDAADATLKACTVDLPGVHAFDVASGDATAVDAIAEMIGEVAGKQLTIHITEPDPGEPQEVAADLDATSAGLAWSPVTHIGDGLRAQVEWWRRTTASV